MHSTHVVRIFFLTFFMTWMLSVIGLCIILSGLCVFVCVCVCSCCMLCGKLLICFSMLLYLPPSYGPINRFTHCVWGSAEFGSWVLISWCETAFTKDCASVLWTHQYFTVQWIPKQCHYSNLGLLKGTPCAVDPDINYHKNWWKIMLLCILWKQIFLLHLLITGKVMFVFFPLLFSV